MEESLTKEQFPQNSSENGALSKEIENDSQMSKNTGLSCETIFSGGGRRGWELEWVEGVPVGPTSLVAATRGAAATGLVAHWGGPRPGLSPNIFQIFQKKSY